jgi:hypothetical protein
LKLLEREKGRSTRDRLTGRRWARARISRVNGPAISLFNLAGARLLLLLDIFACMEKNYAGLFWQTIILVLMVIALGDGRLTAGQLR